MNGNFAAYEREKFLTRLIWLFPAAYVFHIAEEAHGFANWVTRVLGGNMTMGPFIRNNALFMVLLLALCFNAMRQRKKWSTALLFFMVSAQEFWNFIFHIYAQFKFNAYSPGHFTAILLYLPVYLYLSYVCLREGFLTWQLYLLVFVLGAPAMLFTIWAGLYGFGSIPWSKWV